ncbi:MAG: hypothetical protein EOO04_16545 [Chitinophagaceae bacterium]|nr:MAG: hypothetical protein EOO04_16545 [Chitinophagaceae bacterium]
MRRFFGLLIMMLVLASTACKKSDDNKSEDNLTGKWNLNRWVVKEVAANNTWNDSDTYDPGQYLQFDGSGKCVAFVDGELSNTTYELLDNGKTLWIKENNTLDLPAAGFTIQKLTSKELELYSKETDASSTYEITIYLNK